MNGFWYNVRELSLKFLEHFYFFLLFFFSDVAANVIPLLMDFLSDSVNDEASAIEVIHFTREAMAKIAHLR